MIEYINNKEFYFEELVNSARSPGWYQVTCLECEVYTTGLEPVCQDWSWEHECEQPAEYIPQILQEVGVTGFNSVFSSEYKTYDIYTSSAGKHKVHNFDVYVPFKVMYEEIANDWTTNDQ